MQSIIIAILYMLSLFLCVHSLVYVHIGKELPEYLEVSIAQTRVFNPSCPIYVIANQEALDQARDLDGENLRKISCESLRRSPQHSMFLKASLDKGLFQFAKERFYYLDELIRQYKLQDVFHIENDVMLYFNLEEKLPLFQTFYKGMVAAPFDSDTRAVPSFVYIQDAAASSALATYFASKAHELTADMQLLSQFKDFYYKTIADHLPIVPPTYIEKHPLMTSGDRKRPKNEAPFLQHAEEFQLIFDAAAIGQFLDGVDPFYHEADLLGFINESCVFNVGYCGIEWKKDEEGRYVPWISCGPITYKIANLHIHSKRLHRFYSLNDTMPAIPQPLKNLL